MIRVECTECGCKLWSDHAKSIKLCPECESEPPIDMLDLEDQLEELLK